jgi:hypothetical protein
MSVIDPDALGVASKHVRQSLAKALLPELKAKFEALAPKGPYVKNGYVLNYNESLCYYCIS